MRVLAVLLAAAWLAGTGLATLLAWFATTFPFENTTPENRHALSLILPGAIAFVFATLTLAAVVGGPRQLALGVYAVHIVAALVLLARTLEDSDHSDGTLVLFALAVEFA